MRCVRAGCCSADGFAHGPTRLLAKRLFDLVVSVALLTLLLPFLLIAMLAIYLESGRPIRSEMLPIAGQVEVVMQLLLRQLPAVVGVQCRHAHRQPPDGALGSEDRAEIAAIAAADDGHRAAIDLGSRGQQVVGGEDVVEVSLARYSRPLAVRGPMAAEVEREADAAERSDLARAHEVLRLAFAPAMDEQHPWERRPRDASPRRDDGRRELVAADIEANGLLSGRHQRSRRHT